jgi:hypothetical protein
VRFMVANRMWAWPSKMCRAVERTFLQQVYRQESTASALGVRWSTNREFELNPPSTAFGCRRWRLEQLLRPFSAVQAHLEHFDHSADTALPGA